MPSVKREAEPDKVKPKRQRLDVDRLKERAQRLLELPINWKPLTDTVAVADFAIFQEYKRFLVLKTLEHDVKVSKLKLSPSAQVDEIWHGHMLLPRHYADVCAMLLQEPGGLFEHSVLTASRPDRHERYLETLKLYERCWGKPPAGFWPDEPDPQEITLTVVGLDGKKLYVTADKSRPLRALFEACADKWTTPIDAVRLISGGKSIIKEKTAEQQGLRDGGLLCVVLSLRGC